MTPLTEQQSKLLRYLQSRKSCPTFEEMAKAMDLKSKAGVHRLVSALEERGYIRRLPNRARAIVLIDEPRLPETLSPFPTNALVRELTKRGLVCGHYHRSTFRVGDKTKTRREFVRVQA